MSCITIDSGTSGPAGSQNDGTGRQGALASLFRGALCLVYVRRTQAALAMMSERELDDLGLLPWEVRSEDWQKESAAAARCLAA
jgi:uncharacterized protein YjiS (DUF1127 family)